PGVDRVDPARGGRQPTRRVPFPGQEVPLLEGPVAGAGGGFGGAAEGAGVVGEDEIRAAAQVGGGGDVVGLGVGDARVAAQGRGGAPHAGPGRQLQHPSAALAVELDDQLPRCEAARGGEGGRGGGGGGSHGEGTEQDRGGYRQQQSSHLVARHLEPH